MATLLVSPLSRVQRNQRNDVMRRRRAAIAEMQKNGIIVSPEWAKAVDDPEPELPALNVRDINRDDFVSALDAKPMSDRDINNVESLGADELQQRLTEVAQHLGSKRCNVAYAEWQTGKVEWADEDLRWTLSPHELKKLAVLS